jgi:hypothetical protein
MFAKHVSKQIESIVLMMELDVEKFNDDLPCPNVPFFIYFDCNTRLSISARSVHLKCEGILLDPSPKLFTNYSFIE